MYMGILGLSVEEKIASGMQNVYAHSGVLADYSKGDLTRQAKALLANYQQGILSGSIGVITPDDYPNEIKIKDLLYDTTGFPMVVIIAFMTALYQLVQNGDIELKHLDPRQKDVKTATTGINPSIIPNMVETVTEYQNKMVLIGALGLGGALAAYIFFRRLT